MGFACTRSLNPINLWTATYCSSGGKRKWFSTETAMNWLMSTDFNKANWDPLLRSFKLIVRVRSQSNPFPGAVSKRHLNNGCATLCSGKSEERQTEELTEASSSCSYVTFMNCCDCSHVHTSAWDPLYPRRQYTFRIRRSGGIDAFTFTLTCFNRFDLLSSVQENKSNDMRLHTTFSTLFSLQVLIWTLSTCPIWCLTVWATKLTKL